MAKKNNDLQPWLDYFDLLRRYADRGFLQIEPQKHEAYVTRAALHALTPGDDPAQQLQSGAIADTARRIRAYAGYLSQQGPAYLAASFAVHVVAEDEPHDLLYTMLLTQRRSWRTAWQTREEIEVINYQSEES